MKLELAGFCDLLFCLQTKVQTGRRVFAVIENQQMLLQAEQIAQDWLQVPYAVLGDWEILPFDEKAVAQNVNAQRLHTLHSIFCSQEPKLYLLSAASLQIACPAPEHTVACFIQLSVGQNIGINHLVQSLAQAGFNQAVEVSGAGQYAVRGGQLDVFFGTESWPVRVLFDDDEIEEMRYFDVDSQRSIATCQQINTAAASQIPSDLETSKQFYQRLAERFSDLPDEVLALVENHQQAKQIDRLDNFLPLFFDRRYTIFDYLNQSDLLYVPEQLGAQLRLYDDFCAQRYTEQKNRHIVLLCPECYLSTDETLAAISNYEHNEYTCLDKSANVLPLQLSSCYGGDIDLLGQPDELAKVCLAWQQDNLNGALVIVTASSYHFSKLKERLLVHFTQADCALQFVDSGPQRTQLLGGNDAGVFLTQAYLSESFQSQQSNVCLFAYDAFCDLQVDSQATEVTEFDQQLPTESGGLLSSLQIELGDIVVHERYGIGVYQGLVLRERYGIYDEYIDIMYANDSHLYIGVEEAGLLSRHQLSDMQDLSVLGRNWNKVVRKARQQSEDTAAWLLQTYAQLEQGQKAGISFDAADYEKFAALCQFRLSTDQQRATNEILANLQSQQLMDRMLIADVGFGKTEVAMRAAFVTAATRQVVLLAPTTILVHQHLRVWQERFAAWPINIAMLSGHASGKERSAILEKLQAGQIDIIIGTHALLSDKVKFANLGLLIIDEEHRFGVVHKEKLRHKRGQVDMLSLSATPIPRSLSMALQGIKSFSVINTPPPGRLDVHVSVEGYSKRVIREACLREFMRGGQVYFVHNEVADIERMRIELEELLPDYRLGVLHGQLPKGQISSIMREFLHRRIDVLLCTTIIESGLDIHPANTIIINNAQRLGLAQIHQLRGRIGRTDKQAYAYFLVPERVVLTTQANKRIEAAKNFSKQGKGFMLAMQDLEIRGAGEVFGHQQSGVMQQVGLEYFEKMLKQAIKVLSGKSPQEAICKIEVSFGTLIEDVYCPSPVQRLRLYRQLANCEEIAQVREIRDQMFDRFGRKMPEGTMRLLCLRGLEIAAGNMGIDRISIDSSNINFFMSDDASCHANAVLLISSNQAQVGGDSSLQVAYVEHEQELLKIKEVLEKLGTALGELEFIEILLGGA